MKITRTFLAVCVISFILSHSVLPKEVTDTALLKMFGPPGTVVPLVSAPALDGSMDDAAWKKAKELPFVINQGGGKATQASWVKVVSDKTHIYLLVYCYENDMDRLVSSVKKTDGPLWSDDSIEMFFDPGHTEGFSYCHFIFNPDGVAFHAKAGKTSWNPPSLKTASIRKKDAWGLEIKISFKDLAGSGKVPRMWGANFMRMRQPKLGKVDFGEISAEELKKVLKEMDAEESAWSPTHLRTSHVPSRFGHLYLKAGTEEDPVIKKYIAGKSLKPKGKFPVRPEDLNRLIGSPSVMVPTASKAIVIDGKLDDPAWKEAAELNLKINQGGGTPVHKTIAKIAADKENLYIGYTCYDKEMEFLVADSVGKGNARWGEDTIEIFFDPYHTHQIKYYNIMINPVGAYSLSKNGFDKMWDPPSFKLKTGLYEEYWTAEFKIAFKDLLKDTKAFPTVWSLNLIRTRAKKFDKIYEDTAWAPTNQNASHIPEMFGHAYFELGTSIPKVVKEFIKTRDALVK